MSACTVPPDGWACSRAPGHDGPCAARPTSAAECVAGKCPAPDLCDSLSDCDAFLLRQETSAAPGTGISDIQPPKTWPGAPGDEWWARRWWEKATPTERDAMRRLVMESNHG